MKILLITRQFPFPLHDGESIAVQMMSLGLSHAGADLHLLALNTIKHYYDDKEGTPEELAHYSRIQTVYIDNRIRWTAAFQNWLSKASYHISRYHTSEVSHQISTMLRSEAYDMIQLEGLHLLSYVPLIRRHTDAKIIYRAHNVEFTIWQRILEHMGISLKRYYLAEQVKRLRQFEITSIGEVDAILAVSKEDAAFFKRHTNQPIKVVPIGVNHLNGSKSRMTSNEHPTRMGFIGSLDWMPNREGLNWYMENVHVDVAKNQKLYELSIAGRKSDYYQHEFVHYPKLNWMGEVPDAEVFWGAVDILIVPLLAGSGTRVKIIEALARGKYVITTAIGVEGINYEGLSQITIANTAKEWQEAIVKSLTSPAGIIDQTAFDHWLAIMDYKKIGEALMQYLEER